MTHGACASGDVLSAETGCAILEAGGNAADAAVGAALMAAFSLPTMTGLAGGGIMTVCFDREVHVLDHFAAIPGKGGTRGVKRDPEVIYVPFEGVRLPFKVGRPTIAVPGAVAGLWAMHERFGRLPMKVVAEPAIAAARAGVKVTDGQRRAFALLEPIFRRSPSAWRLIGKMDHLIDVGDTMTNPDLGDFIEFLVEEGARGFYEGDVAAHIEATSDGFVTTQDLADYTPAWRRPLERMYREHHVWAPGMPSLSGAMLLCGLAHLEAGGPLPRFGEHAYWERVADAMRAAANVRTEDYENHLFDEGFLEGVVAGSKSGCTMQCSVIDDEGNAVSYTSTVGEGAGFVIPGTGVMLNNFLGEDDIFPEHAQPDPGSRMMTSMAPVIARQPDGRLCALGAAGSARIKSALLQVLVHIIDGGALLQDAVEYPRIHTEGDTVYIEAYGRTPEEVDALKDLGSEAIMTYEAGFFFGGVQAAAQRGDRFVGAADVVRRGCGFAEV